MPTTAERMGADRRTPLVLCLENGSVLTARRAIVANSTSMTVND
jgi:hypothetical protein